MPSKPSRTAWVKAGQAGLFFRALSSLCDLGTVSSPPEPPPFPVSPPPLGFRKAGHGRESIGSAGSWGSPLGAGSALWSRRGGGGGGGGEKNGDGSGIRRTWKDGRQSKARPCSNSCGEERGADVGRDQCKARRTMGVFPSG